MPVHLCHNKHSGACSSKDGRFCAIDLPDLLNDMARERKKYSVTVLSDSWVMREGGGEDVGWGRGGGGG